MKAHVSTKAALLFIVLLMAGCANDAALRTAVAELDRNTGAVNHLLHEQSAMIQAKAPPADVYAEVAQADPFLNAMAARCRNAGTTESNPYVRYYHYVFSPGENPSGLSSSCTFYTELSGKFVAQMLYNSGRYYAGNGDREKAERTLRDLTDNFTAPAYLAEFTQAKLLLDDFTDWDSFTKGWKAYILGDYSAALAEYKDMDEPQAMYKVGAMYDNGEGVPADKKQAQAWYLKAARKGFDAAQYRMGMIYASGDGVEPDRDMAAEWFAKAAQNGYGPAKQALKKLRQ